jgi:hypothetical protein
MADERCRGVKSEYHGDPLCEKHVCFYGLHDFTDVVSICYVKVCETE